MNVVLLRVGIDSGSGGIHGPLFEDGSFELLPIPDNSGVGARTYGNTTGLRGIPFSEYFPRSRQAAMVGQAMHVDPEFDTFTYGDPTSLKAGLRKLLPGDILAFYAGLEGWGHRCAPALYLVGYFVVQWAGRAGEHSDEDVRSRCGTNFHVVHDELYTKQRNRLVLVKGGPGSRLLSRAHCISVNGQNHAGTPMKVLSPAAQHIFSDFNGAISIQRSPPRWVPSSHVDRARDFLLQLP